MVSLFKKMVKDFAILSTARLFEFFLNADETKWLALKFKKIIPYI